MLKTFVCKDPEEATRRACTVLEEELSRTKDTPTLLLLSGGSALGILDSISEDAIPEDLTVGMLDDRYSADPKVNNFSLFLNTEFYQRLKKRGVTFLDSSVDPREEPLEAYSSRLEAGLRAWREEYPEGRVLVTQGIGADGHTVGIFPYPEASSVFEELFMGSRWVVGYDAGEKKKYPLRATATLTFLSTQVDFSLLYAVGAEKGPALDRLFEKDGILSETPARVIHEMKSVVVVSCYTGGYAEVKTASSS